MLKRNIAANFVGKIWSSAMALVFIPLYIRYLGVDAYGIIGVFAVLQTALNLLDLGMTPTLSREMARFTGGGHDASSIRNTLRTAECFAVACGAIACSLVFLFAPWLVESWLKAGALDTDSTITAVRVMGLCVGTRFLEGIYQSSIMGLQRQVLSNSLSAGLATLRGGGAVAVIALISPTLEAFFAWQAIVSACGVIAQGAATYRLLPPSHSPVRPTMQALRQMRRFAGGMMGMAILILLLTNVDKILLSHLVDLREYGYYTLAATVASGLWMATAPIGTAYLPQLTRLHAADRDHELRSQFHQGAQIISVLGGSTSITGIVFADHALLVWTGDKALTEAVTPLMRLLLLGNLFSAFTQMPYYSQLAYGRVKPMLLGNIASVLIIVPAIFVAVPRYGASGAAAVYCCLQVGYILIAAPFIFDRILAGEKKRWYLTDLALPIGTALLAALLLRSVVPIEGLSRSGMASVVVTMGLCCLACTTLATPTTRGFVNRQLGRLRVWASQPRI
jgi:O-antigen/teichoic acid export membrane protein